MHMRIMSPHDAARPPPLPPLQEMRAAALTILPILVAAAPFAMAIGTLGTQAGLSVLEITLMSTLVFAGGSQFVTVELWTEPAVLVTLAFATLIVNLRHVLMGAALAPHLGRFGRKQLALCLFWMTDETWALVLRRAQTTPLTPLYYITLSIILWTTWVAGTLAGAALGTAIEDPRVYGFDFAFAAIFLTLLVGMWRGGRTGWPWATAAATAVLVHQLVPGAWYIFAGAVAGGVVGYVRGGPAARRPAKATP